VEVRWRGAIVVHRVEDRRIDTQTWAHALAAAGQPLSGSLPTF